MQDDDALRNIPGHAPQHPGFTSVDPISTLDQQLSQPSGFGENELRPDIPEADVKPVSPDAAMPSAEERFLNMIGEDGREALAQRERLEGLNALIPPMAPGTRVRLKSGGPALTVVCLRPIPFGMQAPVEVELMWFNECVLVRDTIPALCLIPIDPLVKS